MDVYRQRQNKIKQKMKIKLTEICTKSFFHFFSIYFLTMLMIVMLLMMVDSDERTCQGYNNKEQFFDLKFIKPSSPSHQFAAKLKSIKQTF